MTRHVVRQANALDAPPAPPTDPADPWPHVGQLQQRVRQYLYAQQVPELDRVGIEKLDEGVILLRGRISSPRSKWLCVNCCRRVAGVVRLIDRLVVDAKRRRPHAF